MSHLTRLHILSSQPDVHSSVTTLTNDIQENSVDNVQALPSEQFRYRIQNAYQPEYNGPINQRVDATVKEPWKWTWTVINIVVMTICPACIACTLSAFVCNLFAYVDHSAGDYKRMENKLKCVKIWTVVGFILGVITLVVLLSVLLSVAQNAQTT